jgi:hypothetical protein
MFRTETCDAAKKISSVKKHVFGAVSHRGNLCHARVQKVVFRCFSACGGALDF